MSARLLLTCAALTAAGCASVGRDYQPPAPAAPAAWTTPQATAPGVGLARWWTAFHDPQLERLVERAMTANFDARIAVARLREVRATLGVAEAAQGPQGELSGAATRSRSLFFFPGGTPIAVVGNGYQVGFDASWELDVFGGTRRAVEAANADLGAAEAGQREVLVSVCAEVVRTYLELTSAGQRLRIATAVLDDQRQNRDLVAVRVQAGLTDQAVLAQAEAQLASNQAVLPALAAARAQAAHRLALLVGEPLSGPDAAAVPTDAAAMPDPVAALEAGLPSQLLRRRPDLQRAERELAAATARVGVATADLYPSFSLTGAFGFESLRASDLLTAPSHVWSIGPTLRWPVLGAGLARIHHAIDAADARGQQALLRYEQAVLTAFTEVEDALVGLLRERERCAMLANALAAHRRALALVRDRQEHGIDDYLAVLREELAVFEAEDEHQLSRRAVGEDLVALAKALGGGWEGADATAP